MCGKWYSTFSWQLFLSSCTLCTSSCHFLTHPYLSISFYIISCSAENTDDTFLHVLSPYANIMIHKTWLNEHANLYWCISFRPLQFQLMPANEYQRKMQVKVKVFFLVKQSAIIWCIKIKFSLARHVWVTVFGRNCIITKQIIFYFYCRLNIFCHL